MGVCGVLWAEGGSREAMRAVFISSCFVRDKTVDARLSFLSRLSIPKHDSPGVCERPVKVCTIHEKGLDAGGKGS